jgi:hypothetical protein
MIRGVIIFLILWLVITTGINVWRSLTGLEKFDIMKSSVYGLVTAMLTFGTLFLIVVLF